MIGNFFQDKYGKEICDKLLKNNQLLPENIKDKNCEDQSHVKKHIEIIKDDLKLETKLKVNETNWAFDFSGWLGKLENNNNLKKYMIVGLEPHVERYDFQVTYGLSDKTPQGNQRFSIGGIEDEGVINCKDDSSVIWTNLFKIMASDEQINDVFKNKNEKVMIDFLNQFYITDLCHFAPQDKANAINDIKDWKKIRRKVALHFLKREIELVKPEIIITQGNGVFSELKSILKFNVSNSYPLSFGKNNWSVKTGQCKENKYKVLSIPHFGSALTNKIFYMNNLDLVRDVLITNGLK
jgi:hypothetical protein